MHATTMDHTMTGVPSSSGAGVVVAAVVVSAEVVFSTVVVLDPSIPTRNILR